MKNINYKIDDTIWKQIRLTTNAQIDCSSYSSYLVKSKYKLEFMNGNEFDATRAIMI